MVGRAPTNQECGLGVCRSGDEIERSRNQCKTRRKPNYLRLMGIVCEARNSWNGILRCAMLRKLTYVV